MIKTRNVRPIFVLIALFYTATGFAQDNNKVTDKTVEELIQSKQKLDESGAFKDRYTIQLYYGKREEATDKKEEYEALKMEWKCDLFWESPNLAVRIGKFRNRLEADQALIKIREQFPNAIVMKP
jgi:hypothetical protein